MAVSPYDVFKELAISPRDYRIHHEGGPEAHQASLSRQVQKLW